MTPERMQRAYELFEQVLERPTGERSAFLAEACGDDGELRAEVESLLEHDSRVPDDFMQPVHAENSIRGARMAGKWSIKAAGGRAPHIGTCREGRSIGGSPPAARDEPWQVRGLIGCWTSRRPTSSGRPRVPVMQAANLRNRDDSALA